MDHTFDIDSARDALKRAFAEIDDTNLTRTGTPHAPIRSPEPTMNPPQIPGYEIRRELARGGQGVVYEAVQVAAKRDVALKILLAGPFASAKEQQRFELEVELAGNLRHPNILPIFDSGVIGGFPYYSMPLVCGRNLDHHVNACDLELRDIVRLFIQVCSAVAYAHDHGVIHRDLKPSNIMVDDQGTPYLMDFGLAARSRSDLRQSTISVAWVGTLAYASPEQISKRRSEPIGARSDVYSLGIMLYRSLTGAFPYAVTGDISSVLQNVRHADPRLPSLINNACRGDMDAILLKALEKDPTRRYKSVSDLRDDLIAFLQGRLVTARRPTLAYRTRKWLRRNKLPFVVISLLLSSLIVFTCHAVYERNRALNAESATLQALADVSQARDAADEVAAFLENAIRGMSPNDQGRNVVISTLLSQLSRHLDGALEKTPDVEYRIRMLLGRAFVAERQHAEAQQQFHSALQLSSNANALSGAHRAEALAALAGLDRMRHRWVSALKHSEEALSICTDVHGQDHLQTIQMMVRCGRIRLAINGHQAEGQRLLGEAANRLEHVRLTEPGDQLQAAALRSTTRYLTRSSEAVAATQSWLSHLQEHFGDTHPRVLPALLRLADAYRQEHNHDQANVILEEAESVSIQHFGHNHIRTHEVQGQLAQLAKETGHHHQAAVLFRNVADNTTSDRFGALMRAGLGHCLYLLQKRHESLATLHEAIADAESLGIINLMDFGNAYLHIGKIHLDHNDPMAAETPLRKAIAIFERVATNRHWKTNLTRHYLGVALVKQGCMSDEALYLLTSSQPRLKNPTRQQVASAHIGLLLENRPQRLNTTD